MLAVGFTDTKEFTQRPVLVCRLIDEPDKSEFREHGVQYRYAIRRCRNRIEKHILHQFLKNDAAERAIKGLNYLLEYNTNSFMPYLEFFVQVPMNQMTGSQLRLQPNSSTSSGCSMTTKGMSWSRSWPRCLLHACLAQKKSSGIPKMKELS